MQPPFDIPGDLDTPVSAFLKLAPLSPHFLLESVEGGERVGRYSFIGFGECRELRIDAAGARLDQSLRDRPDSAEAYKALIREALAGIRSPQITDSHIPFNAGLVGYASFDAVRYFERLERPHTGPQDVPDAHYIAPRSVLVFDHVKRAIGLLHDGGEAQRRSLRHEVIQALGSGIPQAARQGRCAAPVPSLTRSEFLDRVGVVQEHISAGDVYQLVLSIQQKGEHSLDPFQVYRALRLINPSPYMFYLSLGDVQVAGSSPEALVRLQQGKAQLRPIAGTRPRATDPAVDSEHERALLADEKENAEHVMLVDLARNDLGRVAAPGSVRVHPYKTIERYSHVMHMVSGVEGELAPGTDAVDLFAAAFPAGTLVGAPKVRAMQLIDELEPVRRGLYGGTVGYFGANGSMDQAITIRTVVMRGDQYTYQAGAGIVADSDPVTEYAEVQAKSAAMARALALATTRTEARVA